mmetsp:Transcript_22205/g.46204  ORF Transcript_22205/g.46204 Transcript_22205/m.46204 type:complete len:387 (+) Transcript_22205:308-1468(+)
MVQTRRAAAASAPKRPKNKWSATREKLDERDHHPSPTAKRARHDKSASVSKVTPSPKSNAANNRNGNSSSTNSKAATTAPSSPWRKHDHLLHGIQSSSHYKRELTASEQKWDHLYMFLEYSNNLQDKKFKKVMEHLLREDSLFQKEFGIDYRPCHQILQWSRWAVELSTYPKKRMKEILIQYEKDMELHHEVLTKLLPEINERKHGGKRYYLRALNCIFFDSFARCHVPLPPLPSWDLVVHERITRKELYKCQLRAWEGYRSRCFAIVRMVIRHPRKREEYELKPVEEVAFRGEMVSMKDGCTNEENVIDYSYDFEELYDDEDDEQVTNILSTKVEDKTSTKRIGDQDAEEIEEHVQELEDLEEPQCSCLKCKETFYCWAGSWLRV